MNTDLSGKIALVTGASRGLGRAVALAYAKAGAHVLALARTTGALEELDDEIRASGGQATLIPQDLRDFDKLDTLGPALAQKFGCLDIFIGNAGLLGAMTPLGHADAKDWARVMDVNLHANFRLIRTLDPLLRAAPAGRAIFTGSSTYDRPKAYWGAYRISKAALHMLVMTYAAETEKTNLRVNIVHPGAMRTKMLGDAYPGGYPGDDAVAPEALVPLYLELASPDCVKHGQAVSLS